MKTKGGLFNLKINPQIRDEFKVAAELRGATMSSLIHQFIFRYIREVKMEMPDEFEAKLAEILAEKRDSSAQAAPAPDNDPTRLNIDRPMIAIPFREPAAKKGGRPK